MGSANFWSGVVEAVLVLCAVTGALVGVFGLRTWRQQLRGKSEYDFGRRLLGAAIRIRSAIEAVRYPLFTLDETVNALRQEGLTDEQIGKIVPTGTGQWAVYRQRWALLEKAVRDLDVETVEAEVLWGSSAREKISPLRKCIHELYWAIFDRLHDYAPNNVEVDDARRKEIDKTIYDRSRRGKHDGFADRVDEAIKGIEELVKPFLLTNK